RNPFRFHVDPVTGWVLVGNVGQDASNDDLARGPAGYDEWYIVTEPGQVAGWPFCTGPAEPFVDYDFETEEGQGLFDCSEAIPAVIWYKYAETEQFPELGSGGRNAQAGPILREPEPDARYQWREEYLNKWFIYEWTRHFVKMVTLGENGGGDGTELPELHSYTTIGAPGEYGQVPRPDVVIEDFIEGLSRPMDLTQAPDGALYLLEYGMGWFEANEDARLSRIYNKTAAAPPVAMASAEPSSGQGPLTVQFSAEGSFDVDGDGITAFEWDFGDGATSTEADPTHSYAEDGEYQASLRATGSYGTVGESDPVVVVVGNTAPEAEIARPLAGAIFEQNQTVTLEGAATDAEEGELAADSLEWEVVARRMVGGEAQEETVLSVTGASAELDLGSLEAYDWHGAVAYLVRLTATDSEGLSGTTEARLRYTRLQAQQADQSAGAQLQSTRDQDGEEDAVLSRSGDYLAWQEVDVTGRGPAFVRVDADADGSLELRTGGPEGDTLGSAEVTGGEGWQTVAIPFGALEGPQDLYLIARAAEGDEIGVSINWLQLVGPGPGQ
ncbi:MAG: PKD domain-containing protein, partial [Deinococcota bacterium]|nr:PKD domain-containing protein [Deinococcota bacterium]